MNGTRDQSEFGRRTRQNGQARLIVDGQKGWTAARRSTSRAEQLWPAWLAIGLSVVLFSYLFVSFAVFSKSSAQYGASTYLVIFVIALIAAALSYAILFYVFSSVRNAAETLGNLTLLSASNTGFKIGAAIGFGLFLYFNPVLFGDPFTGNPSAPSAIVAQLILKSLGFMGIAGVIGSRIERAFRGGVQTET